MIKTRKSKIKSLIVALVFGTLTLTTSIFANVPVFAGDPVGTLDVTTERIKGNYDGLVITANETINNAGFMLDLTPNDDNGVTLPSGEKYLVITHTGRRSETDYESISQLFYAYDKDGNEMNNNALGNASIPAVTLSEKGNFLTYAQSKDNGVYYRKNTGASNQLGDGMIFIPFNYMSRVLNNIEELAVISNFADNDRAGEIVKIEVAGFTTITADTSNGQFNKAGVQPSVEQVLAEYNANKVTLVDFTTWTDESILKDFASDDIKSLCCVNRTSIKYSAFNSSNNSDLLTKINLERSYSYDKTNVYANLNTNLENALKIKTKDDAVGTSKNESDATYDNIRNAYLQLWETSTPIKANDGIAIKLAGLSSNYPFRLFLYSSTGQVYYAGYNGGSENAPQLYNAVREDGSKTTLSSYNKLLQLSNDTYTVYVPYDTLTQITDNKINGVTVNKTEGVITDIVKVALACDNTASSMSTIIKRQLVLGAVADVDVETKAINLLFDTSTYSWATTETDTTADINGFNSALGKTVFGCSKEDDDGSDQPWKNESWQLEKATAKDLLAKFSLIHKYVGDVRIFEDFELPKGYEILTDNEKEEMFKRYLNITGATSYPSMFDNSQKGFGNSLKWKIGNYGSEWKSGMSQMCTWIAPTIADGYSSLVAKDANGNDITPKGMTAYIKNERGYALDLNFEFEFAVKVNGETKKERWQICMPGSMIYAYDIGTGREFRMPSTSHATESSISIPAGFEGWIRVPFSSMYHPGWTMADSGHSNDGVFDFADSLNRVFINCHMRRNSNAEFLFDNYGFYYSDFEVKSSFHAGQKGIADCLALNDYFA